MGSEGGWTKKQNKLFENGLAIYDKETPDRWENLARYVGDKSVEEIKKHYDLLVEDVNLIEAGKIPLPNYISTSAGVTTKKAHNYIAEEQRMKDLRLQ
ncbi:hypothetical protein HS088_TW06G01297 [Tripterygium wilfordii]|uniref:SANT domain-containing protein n=2 Tax=Tripterygium wilfordii TaxID=458696 RepID=A0A7J7DM04_TRIWF|nr:hypothetical protein HS088_TW06G01297 [Tripterygium wilfordii]